MIPSALGVVALRWLRGQLGHSIYRPPRSELRPRLEDCGLDVHTAEERGKSTRPRQNIISTTLSGYISPVSIHWHCWRCGGFRRMKLRDYRFDTCRRETKYIWRPADASIPSPGFHCRSGKFGISTQIWRVYTFNCRADSSL